MREHAQDDKNWIYAPHLNWYTYAIPRQMKLAPLTERPSGEQSLLKSPLGSIDITSLPEFKGLVLPLREKRASLHDWLAMHPPEKRNLALITSHVDDLFFVSTHSALLYFPDDPNFLVLHFQHLLETATRLYCLVTSMVARAKVEFDELAELEEEVSEDINEPGKLGIFDRERLLNRIRDRHASSEHFDSDARRALDLLTLRVISLYVDTTKLMQAMTDELEINNLRQLFDETMDRVKLKRAKLLESVERLQSDQIEEQRNRLQTTTAIIATLLAAAGVDTIITDFQAAFSSPLLSVPKLHLLIILVVIMLLAFFLLRYVGRSRAIRKTIQRADKQRER
ncbi:MAG TPA: hypothetical protein VKT82_30870 [Ktedonobacterales bacterium]|nr:hypothetical protein [Ktedonobacterales bacterium]